MTACGLATIVAGFVNVPMLAIYFYIVLINSCLVTPIVGSVTVSLYPTNLRAMAVNMSMMIGHIGASLGANFVGVMLKDNCEITFYGCGAIMIITGIVAFLLPKPKN